MAQGELAPIAATMDLEAQALDDDRLSERVTDLANKIVAEGRQWRS
ncbi:MAG: hypothetical protein ACC652_09190 [Acidimicrobiales bacterium]